MIEATAFTPSAQLTPDMTVKISGSTKSDNLAILTSGGDLYHGWNTANENVTISSNATGVTKKDHIVAYIDTALTTTTPDNPGGLVLVSVRGTGTAAPTDGEINTATGSKPWLRLAEVTVTNGASSINSGNITDLRTFARVDGARLKAASVPDSSLANGKISRRKGGSASNWNTAGTTDYDVSADNTVIQVGAATSSSSAYVTVTFPVAFTQPPIVITTGVSGTTFYTAICEQITTTDFRLSAFNTSNARVAQTCQWVAIGK